jgi:hypothetical protein
VGEAVACLVEAVAEEAEVAVEEAEVVEVVEVVAPGTRPTHWSPPG